MALQAIPYNPTNQCKIALKGHHGRHITAESDGSVSCRAEWIKAWEEFISEPIGVNLVALKSHHFGKYMSADKNGKINTNSSQIGASEKFEVVDRGNGTFGFKSAFNKYLCAQHPSWDVTLQCDRDKCDDWEQFNIVVLEIQKESPEQVEVLPINRRPMDDVSDDEDEKEIYKKIKKKSSTFVESTEENKIDIAVGKIAAAISSAVGVYASGGALLPVFIKQIEETVIHASWSTSEENQDVMEQFFEDGNYLFLCIHRETKTEKKGIMGWGSTEVHIECNVKFFYAEPGNEAAKKELQRRATAAASDAFKWIDSSGAGQW